MNDMTLAYWGMCLYHWWHRIRLARIQEHQTAVGSEVGVRAVHGFGMIARTT